VSESTPAGRERTLIIIPTYNESENVERIIARTRAAVPHADILIADDNSPDGTGKLADAVAAADDHIHVMHRLGKEGLGAAYLAGFEWGINSDYDVLVEMDADGSHQSKYLPVMLDALSDADVVIGSRWVDGGAVENWPKSRLLLSKGGNTYARILLGVSVRDSTAGYRAYRRTALDHIDLQAVQSQGYCFQIDLTRRAAQAGLRIVEVPITFIEREVGESKMGRAIVAEALWRVTLWGVRDRIGQLARRGDR
jgi:dolichol-phosphate mannosyltransferase